MVRKKWLVREDVSAARDATRTIKIALLKSAEGKLNDNQRKLVDTLAATGGRVPVETLQALDVPRTTLARWFARLVEVIEEPAGLCRLAQQAAVLAVRIRFQLGAASRAEPVARSGRRAKVFRHALHGVTGSGKTAVYLAGMRAVLEAGTLRHSSRSRNWPHSLPSPPICTRSSATKLPSCTPRFPTKNAPSNGTASRAAMRAWSSARAPPSSPRSPISP
jgi:hypothetical protein